MGNQEAHQRLSLLELMKSLPAGTLLFQTSIKVMLQLFTAHHTTHGEVLIPGHQLVVNQSLFILMSISKSRLLNATESRNSQHRFHNHILQPCNQEDACIFIQLLLKKKEPHWLSLVKMKIESMPQDSIISQLFHATLKN